MYKSKATGAIEINLRKAPIGLADELTELALRSKAYWGYDEAFMRACRSELTVTAADLAKPSVWYCLAELASGQGTALAGFYKLDTLMNLSIELDALFVDPSYIGGGIGQALFRDALATAKSFGACDMVVQSDPNALEFYQAMGGTIIGYRRSGSIPGRELPMLRFSL